MHRAAEMNSHCALFNILVRLLPHYFNFIWIRYLSIVTGNRDGCPIRGDKLLDLIYIDIVGLKQLKSVLGSSFTHYR